MKKLLVFCLVLVLLGGLAAGAAFVWAEDAVRSPLVAGEAEPVEFTVPRGATGLALGAQLAAADLIGDARLWRYHLWRRGGLAAKAGRFSLSPSMSLDEIARRLEGAPLPEDRPFVMIEGWRLRDTDAALVAQGWIEPGEYIAAAKKSGRYKAPFPLPAEGLEGYLYPETYAVVPTEFSVEALIQRQLDTFVSRFYAVHADEIRKSGRSLHEIVIMASLLEREEPMPEQRPLVAGILWKRIDARVPLGVDATSRYELPEWNDRKAFLKRLRDPADRWNTRTRAGLPPGPIGAPTVDALLSAIRPTPSEFWYYLHDANRILRPSRNAAEHEALRARYKVY
jgi:UPF0755 protein